MSKRLPFKIHYAGALEWRTADRVVKIVAGFAACCYGPEARKIAELGHHTYARESVTCGNCKLRLEAHDRSKAREEEKA